MIIVITGGSRGIGYAIAAQFATPGNTLLLAAKNEKKLQEAVARLKENNEDIIVHSYAADLSLQTAAENFAEWCLGFGVPDILVNNSGIYLPGNVHDEPAGNMEAMMNTNFYSAYYITRKIVPAMSKAGQGHIFNICSIASLQAYPGGGSYSVSKYALDGFTKNLREELKDKGIKVTAVYPGAVFTDSWKGFDNSENRIMIADDIAQMIVAASALSPSAVVEEIILRPQMGDL
ncbi:MAG: SDR family oxidoreductase [Ferruginibacter sp.]